MRKKGLRCQWKPDELNKTVAEIKDGVFTIRRMEYGRMEFPELLCSSMLMKKHENINFPQNT